MGRWPLWIVIAFATSISALYVVNTVLYLTPPNPVKARLLRTIVRLTHPLFAQNWHLFAPDPVRMNHVLTVRCRTDAGVTAWQDVTRPMLDRHHQTRTSPMGRLLRVHQNAIRFYFGWVPDEWRGLICRRDSRADACRRDHPSLAQQRNTGLYLLQRVASAACDGLVGPGRAHGVQMRVLVHRPPAWSRRHHPDSDGQTEYIPLPWMPLVQR